MAMATPATSSPAKSTSRGGEDASGLGNTASQVLGGRVVVVVLVVEVEVVAGEVPSAGSVKGPAVVPVGGPASVDDVPEAAVTDPVPSAGGLSGCSPRSSKKPNQKNRDHDHRRHPGHSRDAPPPDGSPNWYLYASIGVSRGFPGY